MKTLLHSIKTMDPRKKSLIFLLVGVVVCAVMNMYDLFAAFIALLVIQFMHTLFYTEPTKLFGFYAILVFTLIPILRTGSFISAYYALYFSITVFEVLRVILMAIINYPITINDLKTLNEDLEERVNKRTLELQEANAKLRELDQMKTAFVQQASHDLRTPLAAIKGSLDNLTYGVAGELNDKQKRILDRATRSVDRLTNLINDVLDLSRIESGRIKLEKANISFRTIVENAVNENAPAAEAKQIDLRKSFCNAPLFINADAGKIERVVNEMINNAVKYTPVQGRITVSLTENDGYAFLSVQDTGIGLTPEECKRIWERFYRTPDSQFIAKGSGLGLSIAKELVEMHQGGIRVISEKGKGTTFIINIPLLKKTEEE